MSSKADVKYNRNKKQSLDLAGIFPIQDPLLLPDLCRHLSHLKKEGACQRGQIHLLQAKYTAKKILTCMNKKKAKVLVGVEAYNKMHTVDSNPLIPNDTLQLKDKMVQRIIERVTRILG
ncbi:hypothetical protein CTI12_AA377730 [Artemisia annua]|uniref:Uncharacterized protein n=1 Tax=Artemisia annua TaxID=35608 RepID=A0A2U1MI92_ARTAN|nr:hypothetical protein CTI12_AA377730 [Artemisia annua]